MVGKPQLEELEDVLLELVRSTAVAFDAAEVAHAKALHANTSAASYSGSQEQQQAIEEYNLALRTFSRLLGSSDECGVKRQYT